MTLPNAKSATLEDDLAIGQLLVSFSLISQEQLEEALEISQQTRLVLGKILVITSKVSDGLLRAALQCQTMLREKQLDPAKAQAAMQLVRQGVVLNLDEALTKLGYTKPSAKPKNKLSDLLIESGLVTEEQYSAAMMQSEETGLPVGRLLVLSGHLTDSAFTAALNAQGMVQSGKVTFDEAITSLKSTRRRALMRDPKRVEKDFYSLPDGETSLLGELLIQAGCLTKDQLSNALEMGVSKGIPLGEVLHSKRFASREFIQQALEVQQLVVDKELSQTDGANVLMWIDRERMSLAEARARLRLGAQSNPKLNFTEFAKLLGIISDEDIEKAINVAKEHSDLMLQMLLLAGIKDEGGLKSAALCNSFVELGRLTTERAFVLFDFARSRNISIEQALIDLNWYQGGVSGAYDAYLQETDFDALRTRAERSFQEGRFDEAEKLWVKVTKEAEKFGANHPNFVRSLERLADVFCRTGNLDQAEMLYTRVLIAKTRALPPNSLHTAASVNNLAKVYYFLGRHDEAEHFAMRFLEMYKANFPEDHPDIACALQNLATLYHMQNKFQAAEPYYAKAVDICQSRLGPNHPTTVRLRKNFARLLRSLKRFSEAERLDPSAEGNVTGSWKAISVPADLALYTNTESEMK